MYCFDRSIEIGWENKCKAAIKIAIEKGLNWKISKDLMNSDSDYYVSSIYDIVKKLPNPLENIFIEN